MREEPASADTLGIMDSIHHTGLVIVNTLDRIVWANSAARALLGAALDPGTPLCEACPGLPKAGEAARGSRILDVTQSPIMGPSGSPTGEVLVSLHDVTHEKQQEERIRFLASVLDRAAGGITIIDPSLRIVYVNEAQAAMHNYSVGELVGKTIDVFCDPGEIGRLEELIFAAGEQEGSWTGEAVNYTKDGRAIPVLLSVSMLRNADGSLSSIVGVAKDIHTYKELEQDMRAYSDNLARLVSERTRQLERSRDELEMMFDAVSDFMFVVDRSFNVVRANRFSAAFFHSRRRDLLGKQCYRVWADSDHPCPGCPAARVFEKSKSAFAARLIRDERVHVWAYPMNGSDGRSQDAPSLAFCYGKIMTKELAVEERMQQAEKMASLGYLAAGIAHELRNPLGTILAAEYALRSRIASHDPEVARAFDTIERSIDRSTGIISNLLDFSRKGDWSMRQLNLSEIIGQVLALEQDSLKKQGIEVEMSVPLLPEIIGSPDGLRQVFFNIVHNAVQAMPEGGRLALTAKSVGQTAVRVEVSDTGAGISPDDLPRVFDPFFTTKEPGQGTGLGLSICYREVERHRGHVRVSNRLGRGVRVEVELPCTRARTDGERKESTYND